MNNRMTTHGAVSWSELHAKETTKLLHDFYHSLFGWSAKTYEMPTGKYIELKVGDQSFGGVVAAKSGAPAWLNYITVDNVDAACESALEKGGRVVVPPFDAPPGRIARLADPGGAEFFVIRYRAAG